jgi:hypothetical protein
MKIITIAAVLLLSSPLFSKDLPMKPGYRQLKLSELPKDRNGSLISHFHSEASLSNRSFKDSLDGNQKLMLEAMIQSLKNGRAPMANSIWKKFVRSFQNGNKNLDLNNIIYSLMNSSYLNKRPKLAYRASLFKILEDKVAVLESEKDHFKEMEKECNANPLCGYYTKDELDRTRDLWKRRTKIFEKEMKNAKDRFKETYDEEDGHSSIVLYMGKLFFGSAEAILEAN